MAANNEYGQPSQGQSVMYQPPPVFFPVPANVPSHLNPLHVHTPYAPAHVAPPPYPMSFPAHPDYGAFNYGHMPPPEYTCSYDAHNRGSDAASIDSPVVLNASVPMYNGMPPPHPMMQPVQSEVHHQTPQYYEFSSAAPPVTHYTMQPPLPPPPHPRQFHPVSPVQLKGTQFAIQMQATDKPRDQQSGPQHRRQDSGAEIRQQRRFEKPRTHGSSSSHSQGAPIMVPLASLASQAPSGANGGSNFASGFAGPRHRNSNQLQRTQVAIPNTTAPTRSAVLEEFKSKRSRDRRWQLKELFGHIVEFSGDQYGSRFIQQSIEFATDEERQRLFDEIFPEHTLNLMKDVYGNYVIQKLFEHGTVEQRVKLSSAMIGHIFELSQHVYGCRVVQKALDHIPRERQTAFVRELRPHVLECAQNANANHVIQKLVQRLSSHQLGFLQEFQGHVGELATHPFGCRVLQRCLENLSEFHTRSLLNELMHHSQRLMVDQYGNYIIQYVIANGSTKDRRFLISGLHGCMMTMARHKFASNVVEKALLHSRPEVRKRLIHELLAPQPKGYNPIQVMMKDMYANYVLQTALSVAEGPQKTILVTHVRPFVEDMRRSNSLHNKHLACFERLIGQARERPKS